EDAVKKASATKKALQAARKTAERLQDETRQADEAADVREQALQKQVQVWQVEQAAHQDEIGAIILGRAQAHTELGQEKQTAYLRAIQDLQRQADDLREHLVTIDVALHDLVEEAVNELGEWLDLRRAILR